MRKKSIKKLLLTLLAIIAVGGTIVLLLDIVKKMNNNSVQFSNSLNVLTLDSTTIRINIIRSDTSLILVFNSECDVCRIELEQLLVNYHEIESYNILLLSRQSIKELLTIYTTYNLSNYPNFEIAKIDEYKTEEPFLSSPNPSIYVFDCKGRLIYHKKGYSKPEHLINQIKSHYEN